MFTKYDLLCHKVIMNMRLKKAMILKIEKKRRKFLVEYELLV